MRTGSVIVFLYLLFALPAFSRPPKKDIYQLKIYRLKTNEQIREVDAYLQNAYLPALHRAGVRQVGVFKPVGNDTAAQKSVYVLIPFSSLKQWASVDKKIGKDAAYLESSKKFREAVYNQAPYERLESIVLEAFNGQKHFVQPLKKAGMVFELRSYESPTEKLHDKKVAMFENGEIDLFKRLDFGTVFYAKVLSGNRMPNFIYMPSFESMEQRNAHWKTFGEDPQWKEMSGNPENENKVSVSRIESILMWRADYSDL